MSFSGFDHECMAEALRLARRGLFTTDPNPRVGCVLADGSVIRGRGWHERAGGPHAEVAALRDAGDARGLTAYVTLEPCCHHGRTPPCADALLESGVERVIMASRDPNPRVNGGGAERLRAGGVAVEFGLMAVAAESLNRGFFSRMRHGRPWIRVKTAISLDGRTALRSGDSRWISSEASRRDVQRWRARSSAVLTGIGTVLADDPSLNARVAEAVEQPLRVVADSHWRTPPSSRLLRNPEQTLLAGLENEDIPDPLHDAGATFLPLPGKGARIDLAALLGALAEREVNEVQVEAGARLCGSLFEAGLVDEWLVYQAPVLLGEGGPGPVAIGPLESMAQRTHFTVLETAHFGDNLRFRLQPCSADEK